MSQLKNIDFFFENLLTAIGDFMYCVVHFFIPFVLITIICTLQNEISNFLPKDNCKIVRCYIKKCLLKKRIYKKQSNNK